MLYSRRSAKDQRRHRTSALVEWTLVFGVRSHGRNREYTVPAGTLADLAGGRYSRDKEEASGDRCTRRNRIPRVRRMPDFGDVTADDILDPVEDDAGFVVGDPVVGRFGYLCPTRAALIPDSLDASRQAVSDAACFCASPRRVTSTRWFARTNGCGTRAHSRRSHGRWTGRRCELEAHHTSADRYSSSGSAVLGCSVCLGAAGTHSRSCCTTVP